MRVAVIGAAGAIGRSVVAALHEAKVPLRLVGRNLKPLRELAVPGDEIVMADVATEAGCHAAVADMDAAVYAFGVPYSDKAFAAYPDMMQKFIAAVRQFRLRRILLVTNVYAYGLPQTAAVTEDHPRNPCSVKGEWRKRQEDVFLEASGSGLECISLRLPDFYGPRVANSMLDGIVRAAVAGRTGMLLNPDDQPHEFVFTPDVGPVIRDLLMHEGSVAGAYNLAGAGVISLRGMAELIYHAAGRRPKLNTLSPWLQSVMGLFVPVLRELRSTRYLLQTPLLLDDGKLRALLPQLHKTSYADGARLAVEAEQERSAKAP